MIDFHFLDIGLIAVYFTAILLLGLFAGRGQSKTTDDYILLGRKLTLPGFVATIVTTWYGGILGVGEFTYRYGLVNWITQGLFFYFFAGAFALFFAKRINGMDIYTIPDKLEKEYGRKTALAGSLFIFLMVSPAPYVLILGILLQIILGWKLSVCVIIGILLSMLYLLNGGFKAVVRTDMLQFLLMFAGFLILLSIAVLQLGGIDFLTFKLPDQHLTFSGELGTGYILVWGFIALWTLVDPGFYQRCLAAKSGKTAQRGIFIAIGFWMLFDLLTCMTGLYARAALPDIDPLMAYPLLADLLLPAFLKGLFFTGMLATVMSTVDSFSFLSALTIGNDFIGRIKRKAKSQADIRKYTQMGLVFTAIGAAAIALWSRSVIDIWYTIGSIGIPALLIPVVGSYSSRWKPGSKSALSIMVLSPTISVFWLVWGYLHLENGHPQYPLELEPMYPGLGVSILIYLNSIFLNNKRKLSITV